MKGWVKVKMGRIKENITKGKGGNIGKGGENIYEHRNCSFLTRPLHARIQN
jgi:hypothetical protein